MTDEDIARIETELNVRLPGPYREALRNFPFDEDRGTMNWSLGDAANDVIWWTRQFRSGYAGNPVWPSSLLCIGTEGDACPIALDLETGAVMKLDHGNPTLPPMERYETFQDFMDALIRDWNDMRADRW